MCVCGGDMCVCLCLCLEVTCVCVCVCGGDVCVCACACACGYSSSLSMSLVDILFMRSLPNRYGFCVLKGYNSIINSLCLMLSGFRRSMLFCYKGFRCLLTINTLFMCSCVRRQA